MTNKEKYKKTFDALASSEMIHLEVKDMKKQNRKHRGLRGAAAAVIALLCLASVSTAVYAVGKHFGILDFSSRLPEKVPEEAANLIDTEVDQMDVAETEGSIINCAVKEALCDSETITIVYEVSAKEPGKYLFVPTDALPEDLMSNWSENGDKTAAEYAAEKGLKIVNIGGGIKNSDDLGIRSSSMDFISIEDDVMDVYVRAGKGNDAKSMDVTCVATASVYGEVETMDDIMKKTIQFTLDDLTNAVRASYKPQKVQDPGAEYEVKMVETIQTELGTYVDVFYTNTHGEGLEDGLAFRLIDENGQKYEFVGGSGAERQEDGSYKERIILNKTELGDTIVLEAYDIYEGIVHGTIELTVDLVSE